MPKKRLKIAIVLNVIPSYRAGFYDSLFERKSIEVTVYAQRDIPGTNLKTIHDRYLQHVKLVKFIGAKRERVVWQFLPFRELLSTYDVVVVDGNPRQVSHFILSTLLRILKRRVVLWTMAHSFRGDKLTENLRLLWTKIFKYIFVYTDAEVEFLRGKGFNSHFIVGMNNGLNQRKIDEAILAWNAETLLRWRDSKGLSNKVLLLSCARLEGKNRFDLMIKSLSLVVVKHPNLVWCVIGKGVEEQNLRALVKEEKLEANVLFVGEIYDELDIAPWFLSSTLFIHPAAIGLSLLHAFGYGLPVITSGNKFFHNPEYAAYESGVTGLNYEENNFEDLAQVIMKLLNDKETVGRMKINNQRIAREKYNSEIMVNRFLHIIEKAAETGRL